MKTIRKPLLAAGLIALGLGLAGCSLGPDDNSMPQTFPYVRLSPSAPPQTAYEPEPASPDPMHIIWRRGYWDFDGTTFFWVPGTFMDRPSPTAAWVPDRWEQRMFGWAFVPGYWQ